MALYDPDYRRLQKLVSFPFSFSEAELAAAYLEIFRNCFNLSFQFCLERHRTSTLGALEVTGSKSSSREACLEKYGAQDWEKESQDTPHVFLIPPNLAKMCSLVVLLTNKQAIYCTVKCFILTPYRFLALWLLQVYPLKATQTINQNSIPSHSI